jgi:hypothetical protein
MRPIADTQVFKNISATTAAFGLSGGEYGIDVHATFGGGNTQLQKQAADGSTWINVGSSVTTDGYSNVDLAGGSYRFAITTATAVYINIGRIPRE